MCAASHLVPDPSVLKKLQTCRRTRPAEVRHMPEAAFGHLFRFHLLQMLSGEPAAADLWAAGFAFYCCCPPDCPFFLAAACCPLPPAAEDWGLLLEGVMTPPLLVNQEVHTDPSSMKSKKPLLDLHLAAFREKTWSVKSESSLVACCPVPTSFSIHLLEIRKPSMAAKLAFHGMHSLAASLMARMEFWKAVMVAASFMASWTSRASSPDARLMRLSAATLEQLLERLNCFAERPVERGS
jgi:hypothetical protein